MNLPYAYIITIDGVYIESTKMALESMDSKQKKKAIEYIAEQKCITCVDGIGLTRAPQYDKLPIIKWKGRR